VGNGAHTQRVPGREGNSVPAASWEKLRTLQSRKILTWAEEMLSLMTTKVMNTIVTNVIEVEASK
jgi:hypothetical protein